MIQEITIEKAITLRKDALARGNASAFVEYCDISATPPEGEREVALFNEGLAEAELDEERLIGRTDKQPEIERPVYEETEILGMRIAKYLEARPNVSEVVVRGSLEEISSGAVSATHEFRAQVSLGDEIINYIHPGGPIELEHTDRERKKDLKDYGNSSAEFIADTIKRQGRGRIHIERSSDYDLTVTKVNGNSP
jgi:hypothetical protein